MKKSSEKQGKIRGGGQWGGGGGGQPFPGWFGAHILKLWFPKTAIKMRK